jgi:hypothetical protein
LVGFHTLGAVRLAARFKFVSLAKLLLSRVSQFANHVNLAVSDLSVRLAVLWRLFVKGSRYGIIRFTIAVHAVK